MAATEPDGSGSEFGDMIDDDEDGEHDGAESGDQEQESDVGGKQPAKTKGHPKAKGKSNAKPKKEPSSKRRGPQPGTKQCFVPTCNDIKTGNLRFCLLHRPMADGIMEQAKEADKVEEAQQMMYDEAKCGMAIQRWQKENPAGKFRKKLIDWSTWCRIFDIKKTVTMRETEAEWTWDDWQEEKHDLGWSAARILRKWNEYVDNKDIERDWGLSML